MNSNLIVKNTTPDPASKNANVALSPKSKAELLTEVPEESVLFAVREFIAFHEITDVDELPHIDQAHIITWRNKLMDLGATPRTVNARISAISSLFKHLCEKQIAHRNPYLG